MKSTKTIYWILTGLFAFFMFGSAIPDMLSAPAAVTGLRQMGIPSYLAPFLGIAKALAVIAILVPAYPKIKQWAYAGLTFDLLGATYCIIASGQPVAAGVFISIPLIVAGASYFLYHKNLKINSIHTLTQSRIKSVARSTDAFN